MRSWNRASFELNTRPVRPRRRVTQRDFLVPIYRDRLKLAGGCLVFGGCVALLWVWFPLFIVGVMRREPLGTWLWGSMLAGGLASAIWLFAFATVKERSYLEEL